MSNSEYSNQLPSSSSATSDLPEQPTCEYIDGVPLDWSGRGTSHVDYHKAEVLPLTEGEFLGHGMNGGVYETTCNGIRLAWKRKFCRRKIGERERSEIEIIKKLSHRHIVRLVGTYTHGSFLGLLLWPVATCDLATLLEDVDWLHKKVLVDRGDAPELAEKQSKHDADREARLRALGVLTQEIDSYPAKYFLKHTIGCIASAIAYLHASNIKHKDLKPSNILLSRDGLWLTDFGTATDFSVLTSSVTDEGERGTPKYFAPEVARFAPSGRSADIFSMGCILFEVITLYMGLTLDLSQGLRRLYDRSFQSNLDTIVGWFDEETFLGGWTATDDYLMGLVRWMMEEEAAMRPTADVVEQEVHFINGLAFALYAKRARQEQHWGFFRPCCSPEKRPDRRMSLLPNPKPMITIYVECERCYLPSDSGPQLTVSLKHSGGGLVESVHIFTNRTNRTSHMAFDSPPYQTRSTYGQGISAYIVIRSGYEWTSPLAQPLPKTGKNKMMPIIWDWDCDDSKYTDCFDARISSWKRTSRKPLYDYRGAWESVAFEGITTSGGFPLVASRATL